MHLYKAFNICIESEIQISQFISVENGQTDVSIRFGDVRSLLPRDIGDDHAMRTGEAEICFFWSQVGWYLVRNGNEIIVESYPGAEAEMICLPLIGIAFTAILQQRGLLVLHASAVSIENGAVAFVGWKGAGKSTTAAMLYRRGHAVISDDIVAMKVTEKGAPSVIPGFPTFKLLPETAVSILADDPNDLSRCYTGAEKRFRPFSDNFLQEEVPLRAIYALTDGTDVKAELLKPQEAMSAIIANTYLARYGRQLIQGNHAVTNLRQCSNIVNKIPVYRLERPKSFELIEDLAKFIELQCGVESRTALT